MRRPLYWERRRRLYRAAYKARELTTLRNRLSDASRGAILLFSTIRDEAARLPFFLEYYRRLGVGHFCVVDNGSTDGGPDFLLGQPDVSLWRAEGSYKRSRFGVDWLNWLLTRYAHGHWCVIVDADEFLTYPYADTRGLGALTAHLDDSGAESMGAMLVDLYGELPMRETLVGPGEDPIAAAPWFDPPNLSVERHPRHHHMWIQGGPRMRSVFAEQPGAAPALNKIPLVRWRRGYVLESSTHVLLPRRLNRVYGDPGEALTGALLHAKFLSTLEEKVAAERERGQHYAGGREYAAYGRLIEQGDSLWRPFSRHYEGWRSLTEAGLMSAGGWA